jgi:hypothetical protein
MRSTLFTILTFLLISNANAGNTWQTATPLPMDSSVAGIQSDDDWYVINITGNQSVKRLLIDLTFSHADGNIDMAVYGDDFVSYDPAESVPGLFRAISDSISDHEFIDHNVTVYSPETYYIRVSGEDLGNGYTLTWTELTGTDDGFEENDSSASVKAITEDVVIFGAQSDEDWYSIDVTLGNRRVLASLRFTKVDDLDMVLRDTDGNPLASSTNSAAGANEVIDFEVVTAGTYHLQITGDNKGDGYALDWAGIGVNEVPQAIVNTVFTTENTPYNFVVSDFTFSDNEGDSLVSATLNNLSLAGGTLTHSSGTPVNNADSLTAAQLDTLVYTPPADTTGSPLGSFAFTVNDIDVGTVSAQLDINVTAVPAVTTTTTTTATDTGSSSSALALAPTSLLVLLLTGLLRRKCC